MYEFCMCIYVCVRGAYTLVLCRILDSTKLFVTVSYKRYPLSVTQDHRCLPVFRTAAKSHPHTLTRPYTHVPMHSALLRYPHDMMLVDPFSLVYFWENPYHRIGTSGLGGRERVPSDGGGFGGRCL